MFRTAMIFLFLCVCAPSWGQAVYVELLGKGLYNSVNYEHSFSKDLQGFNVQVGAGFAPPLLITFPASLNYVFGRKSHHFEIGGGVTIINVNFWAPDDDKGTAFGAHANLLYRFQKPYGKFFFKIGATPFIGRNFIINPWIGAGLGYTFKSRS